MKPMQLGQAQTNTSAAGLSAAVSARKAGTFRFFADTTCRVGIGGKVGISGVPYTPGEIWELCLSAGELVRVTSSSSVTFSLVPTVCE